MSSGRRRKRRKKRKEVKKESSKGKKIIKDRERKREYRGGEKLEKCVVVK